MDRSQQIAKYAEKVGHEAAVTRSRMSALQVLMFYFMLITVALLFGSIGFNSLAVRYAFFLSLLPLIIGVITRLWLRHRYLEQASEALGVKVSPLHDVPMSDEQYEIWCRKHGITSNAINSASE